MQAECIPAQIVHKIHNDKYSNIHNNVFINNLHSFSRMVFMKVVLNLIFALYGTWFLFEFTNASQ